jgi:hypothetical protein
VVEICWFAELFSFFSAGLGKRGLVTACRGVAFELDR